MSVTCTCERRGSWVECPVHDAPPGVKRLRGALEKIRDMHAMVDDDPGGPPYCPECQAYDGNPDPCPTSEIAQKALSS